MNVEIGTEAAQFPGKEYINGIYVAVQKAGGHLNRVGGRSGQRKEVGNIPGLGERTDVCRADTLCQRVSSLHAQ